MPAASSLTDDFSTQDTGKWTFTGGASATGGLGTLPISTNYAQILSVATDLSLTSSSFTVELPSMFSSNNNGSVSGVVRLGISATIDQNCVQFSFFGQYGFYATSYASGVETPVYGGATPWDSTSQRWLRFRHDGTTVHYEASSTGASGTWTELGTGLSPSFAITSLQAQFVCGYWDTGSPTPTGSMTVDNVNLPPAAGQLFIPITINQYP